ncbi:hypothetical protein CC86DRAFT_390645 [Ophiobolus disseminans]|uniref:DUF6594 domain-containing protein n=1 Tax=Ophiobolus disseminans TaxID=1469910 RepID=A0A6A7AH82_9PLEO|nr:hypothetical protein CC86DRAFT_390645 [Ophiobolus disseminans]
MPRRRTRLDGYVIGYPKLTTFMGDIPEAAMFWRFGALNARNLLYLHNELVDIEKQLIEQEWEDGQSSAGEKCRYPANTHWLSSSSTTRDGDTKQRDLYGKTASSEELPVLTIIVDHALIQQRTILSMQGPDQYDIRHVQSFLNSETMNWALTGPDHKIWGNMIENDSHSKELVVLKARERGYSLTESFTDWIVHIFYMLVPRKKGRPAMTLDNIQQSGVYSLTLCMIIVVASVMPVISVMILVKMKRLSTRLAVMAGFNALLSICLMVFTSTKYTDMVSMTAAFTSVQVVFVGQFLDDEPKEVIIAAGAAKLGNMCPC